MTEKDLQNLKKRVQDDDPTALFEYAQYIKPDNPKEAYKYTFLAAQLGHPYACELIGEKLLKDGDYDNAASYFKVGAKLGILDCSVKLAVIRLKSDESSAVRELEDLAECGVKSACFALADYYSENGNRKQSAYWRSLVK